VRRQHHHDLSRNHGPEHHVDGRELATFQGLINPDIPTPTEPATETLKLRHHAMPTIEAFSRVIKL
jgi:hypothetical protein